MWSSGEMAEHQNPGVPQDVMNDFMVEFHEVHQLCEATLMEIERTPDDPELMRSLFRSVHTVKGNLSYVLMNGLMPLLQSVEDVLDEVRNDRMSFDDALSDVILLALDATQRLVSARVENAPPPMSATHFDEICKTIRAIVDNRAGPGRDGCIQRAIQLLDPQTGADDDQLASADAGKAAARVFGVERILEKHGIALNDDLAFFRSLITPLEVRSVYWVGRTERLLTLALAMNDQAGRPVDPTQLAAAVFMHDVGMAFLPVDMLHKRDAFSEEERWLLRSHPLVGVELLGRMTRWRPASDMVFQHHERSDGSGYPQGLKDGKICDGAKILGIVESFDARTHERAHRTLTKRPFIRAVLEINNCSGQLFSERWVQVFNDTVRILHGPAADTVH